MNSGNLLVLTSFWILFLATLSAAESRARLLTKPRRDWVLDLTGLLVQGTVIPLLQTWLAYSVLVKLVPAGRGMMDVPGWVAFLLSFVVVDYFYYWNHRLLHSASLWPIHRVHHTLTDRDVLGTSRNTLWSSLFILYLWGHGLFLFLLLDPGGYLLGIGMTAALDLWRHSSLDPRPRGGLHALLAPWLVMPSDHAWHHSREQCQKNFGANLKLWDRLHGTYHPSSSTPETLGIPFFLPLWKQLLWPFEPGKESSK